ncbi:MAG: hypothetical protein JW704_01325 [Anaerolineaceae bacterium]|nr:hypothetical protein [Anaerolineaceae bacterium]
MEKVIVTPENCKAFWAYMAQKEGFTVVEKATAEEMQAIAWAVRAIGGDKNWMKSYTVTIGTRVYVPFKIGAGTHTDRIHQVGTCMHEAQHVRQYKRNPAEYSISYPFSRAARAHYEADAYGVTMESYYYFTGVVWAPGSLANKLKGYYVDEADIHVCKKHLQARAALVKYGVITSGVSKEGLRWWNKRCKGHAKVYI